MDSRRIVYFDYLRILAAFSVVVLHISAQCWYFVGVSGTAFRVFNAYDSIVRWSVPVFAMISGALFLEKEISMSTIYRKNVLRMLTSFVFWSILYAVVSGGDSKHKADVAFGGYYHMWFILMIVGIYVCLPFIRLIVSDKKVCKYYMLLWLTVSCILPTLFQVISDLGSGHLSGITERISGDVSGLNIYMATGYVGYFILGYYLNHMDFSKKQRLLIYLAGLIGFLTTIYLSLYVSRRTGVPTESYYSGFTINVLLECIAIFVLFKYWNVSQKPNRIVAQISKCSFGVYLVHVMIMEFMNERLAINTLSFNPILSVPALSLLVFAIALIISLILNCIPVLKKYIV